MEAICAMIINEYLEELKHGKHVNNVLEVMDYLSKKYSLEHQKARQIEDILFFIQMAYFATDDIIDEGNEIEKRLRYLLQLHYALNKFCNMVFELDSTTRERILNGYNKVFNEMLSVPVVLSKKVSMVLHRKWKDEIELAKLLSEIQILRAKHVLFYWVVGLSLVEDETPKIFDLAWDRVKTRAIYLIAKDSKETSQDRNTGAFNIYNALEDLGYSSSDRQKIIDLVIKSIMDTNNLQTTK